MRIALLFQLYFAFAVGFGEKAELAGFPFLDALVTLGCLTLLDWVATGQIEGLLFNMVDPEPRVIICSGPLPQKLHCPPRQPSPPSPARFLQFDVPVAALDAAELGFAVRAGYPRFHRFSHLGSRKPWRRRFNACLMYVRHTYGTYSETITNSMLKMAGNEILTFDKQPSLGRLTSALQVYLCPI